jgi:CubicO group peptidase (beta-lactamase class C family)
MRRQSLLLAYVFFFATAALSQTAAQTTNAAKVRELEAYVERTMAEQQITGMSMAIVHGDFRWSRGFGFADLENRVPATAESSYRMGSVSKPMTAVAVLKLADEGKIDLDAEVQKYVPYFPRKPYPVTIRQLLSHQGGISHYRDYQKEGRIKEPMNTREAIAIFADFDLVNEPGTKYSYTSYGYNLLGAVVEEVSKQPFGTYMTENVWKPLGMNATRMDDPRAIILYRVDGYVLEEGKLRRSEYVDISSRFGGGGSRSTVNDMVRLFEGLSEGKVLKPATREMAWTRQPTRDGKLTDYGLGFGIDDYNGQPVIVHTGAQQETRTALVMIPGSKFVFALATNFENAQLKPLLDKVTELFVGK